MGFLDRVRAHAAPQSDYRRGRAVKAFSMPPFWSMDGARIALSATSMTPNIEAVGEAFENAATGLYMQNGPVFSCIAVRARVFNQVRFLMQRTRDGRPTDLYWHDNLRIIEFPANTLTQMEVDSSLCGNFYATKVDDQGRIGRQARPETARIVRMRPDWVKLLVGSPSGQLFNVDSRVIALEYAPPDMKNEPLILLPDEFIHYNPTPDPLARFRGMSPLTPIVREAQADSAYTRHKLAFLQNGATPNLVVKMGEDVEDEDFNAFVAKFKDEYEGAANAYKTLFLAGGADVVPLSVDFKQLDLKATQGGIETRIAAQFGVHPTIAGFSEGLQGSTLNTGNFHAARRLFVDSTVRDLWGKACATFAAFAPPPDDRSRLWYDARDIPFLRDDAKDEAETFFTQVQAIRQAIEAGYDPDAAAKAAKAADPAVLIGQHTGMVSVQLQPPGTATEPDPNTTNGSMPTLTTGGNGNGRQITSGTR